MKKILIFICVILITASLFSMPMSPELEKKLREEGRLNEVIEYLLEARIRGVDSPNPVPIRVKPGERLTLKAIAILVDFSDNVATTGILHFDSLLSSVGTYPTGSFRDYFLETSYGNVDIIMTVVGWFLMPQTYAYYTNGNYGLGSYPQNAQKLTEDAVWAADPTVDFSQFDNDLDGDIDALFIVHAGSGAEQTGNPNDIWSHAWSTVNVPNVDGVNAFGYSAEPEDGKIGVFAHEAGHALFGLPDLYDYGYDSEGAGNWTLMAGGSWGNGGRRPSHLDAWCKIECGFLSPHVPTVNQTGVQFPSVEFDSLVYKLWTNGVPANEFFLVENRQKVGFDDFLPGSGLLIYHIDENQSGNDNQWYPGHTGSGHYLVAVEQADGNWDLEKDVNRGDAGDPYPGSTLNRNFNENTTPDSKDYLFTITQVGVENISDSGDTMTADIRVTPAGIEEDVDYGTVIPRFEVSPSISHSEFNIKYEVGSEYISANLKIFDITGRLVKSFSGSRTSSSQIKWHGYDNSGNKVSPGIYFIQLTASREAMAGQFNSFKKVILLR